MGVSKGAKPGTVAKISPPRLHQVVARERLFSLLDDRATLPCTWIHAPPGAGKTTLVGSYIRARELPALWYQIDADDADPSTFFLYLSRAAPPGEPALPALTPEYLPDLAGFARRFFRLLFDRLAPGTVVVFDNFQLLPVQSVTNAVLAVAPREVPESCRMVVMSREDVPATWVDQRASRCIDTLSWDVLKLNADELRRLARLHGIAQASVVESIGAVCDGWAAGITLMLQSARAHPNSRRAPVLAGREHIFDYFAHQLLQDVSEGGRRWLAELSLLPQFTMDMAHALIQDDGVIALLEDLYRQQLFIDRRFGVAGDLGADGPETRVAYIYQMHALFREYLGQQLRAVRDEAAMQEMQLRAARVLEANGFLGAALAFYVAAQSWRAASALIAQNAAELNAQGRWMLLLEFIEQLPEGVRAEDLTLLYWHGMALLAKDVPNSRIELRLAFERARDSGNQMLELLAISGIIWGHYLEGVSMPEMARWIPDLERLCQATVATPQLETMAQFALHTATLWAMPDHPALVRSVDRLLALFPGVADPNQKAMIAVSIVNYMGMVGRVQDGREFARAYERSPDRAQINLLNDLSYRTSCRMADTVIYRAESERFFLDAADEAEENGLSQPLFVLLLGLIYNAAQRRDLVLATDCVRRQARIASPYVPIVWALHRVGVSIQHQIAGDVSRACDAMQEAYEIGNRLSPGYLAISWGASAAGLLAATSNLGRAWSILESVEELSGRTPFRTMDCALRVTRAYLSMQSGDLEAALGSMNAAGEVLRRDYDSQASCLQLVYVLPRVLAAALEYSVQKEIVMRLIRDFDVRPPETATEDWPWPVRIHAFGRWKVEVDDGTVSGPLVLPGRLADLLQQLVVIGGSEVEVSRFHDALWPDMDGDQAQQAFTNVLHRLRRALHRDDVLILQVGRLSLDPQRVWCDVRALESLCQAIHDERGVQMPLQMAARRLTRLYRGKLVMPGRHSRALERQRDRCHWLYLDAVTRLGEGLDRAGLIDDAIQLFGSALEIDDSVESLHKAVILAHVKMGNESRARDAMSRCAEAMRHHFDRPVSRDVQALIL